MFWCLALMVRWRNMVEITIVRSDIMKKRWKHSQLSQLSSQPTNFIHWDEDKVSLSTTLTLHQTHTSKKLLQFSRFSNSWEIIQFSSVSTVQCQNVFSPESEIWDTMTSDVELHSWTSWVEQWSDSYSSVLLLWWASYFGQLLASSNTTHLLSMMMMLSTEYTQLTKLCLSLTVLDNISH